MKTRARNQFYKFRTLAAASLLSCTGASAQNGWLPPVYFPSNTQLCDNTPYKLVFYDDFDGSTLKSDWVPYQTWNGMNRLQTGTGLYVWGDHENWDDAHGGADPNSSTMYRPDNVVVSNGTVKLNAYAETYTWQCPSCPSSQAYSKNWTGAYLGTRYLREALNSVQRTSFSNGRFEARLKMPIAHDAWSAFWTWFGTDVNEIDITEAVGHSNPFKRHNTTNAHAWGPPATAPNPYSLPNHTSSGAANFPGQSFWDVL